MTKKDIFCAKPIGKVGLSDGQPIIVHEEYIDMVDGIKSGGDLCHELMKKHYVYAKQLLGKYLEIKKKDKFMEWLRTDFGATYDQADKCFRCLNAWDKKYIEKMKEVEVLS